MLVSSCRRGCQYVQATWSFMEAVSPLMSPGTMFISLNDSRSSLTVELWSLLCAFTCLITLQDPATWASGNSMERLGRHCRYVAQSLETALNGPNVHHPGNKLLQQGRRLLDGTCMGGSPGGFCPVSHSRSWLLCPAWDSVGRLGPCPE